jgi:ankyrin repeat protein
MTERTQRSQEIVDEFVRRAHGDLDGVQEMLREDPKLLNARSRLDELPLGAAAHVGNKEIAEYLLSQGALLEICAAAMLGMNEVVQEALEADPAVANARGAHGIPILFHAAIGGNYDLARFLVERGAEVTPGGAGAALHAAIRVGHAEMARWLIDLGADVSAPDFQGKTPLERAEQYGRTEIAAMLRRWSTAIS